jgi:hypothetical protein
MVAKVSQQFGWIRRLGILALTDGILAACGGGAGSSTPPSAQEPPLASVSFAPTQALIDNPE